MVSHYHRLYTGHALTLGQQLNSLQTMTKSLWYELMHPSVEASDQILRLLSPEFYTQVRPCLRREWLCFRSEKGSFQSLAKGSVSFKREDHSCRRIFHTSPSVQSSMIIQTGFSVITPMSFTMWGWSNWRIVTKTKRNKLVLQKALF